ncbi:MAG: DUF2490 domain-containing protein [Sandaracinobacter sp.]
MASAPARAALLFASMALANVPAHAEEYLWLQTVAQGPVSGKIVTWLEVQQRFSANTDVTILRPAIGVQLNPKVQLLAGYQYQLNDREDRPDIREHRLWQQALIRLAGTPGKATLVSRTRLEQRFVVDQSDDTMRVRQFVRGQVWLDPRWSLIGAGEAFIGLEDTSWGQREGVEQTRLFAGAAHALTPRLTLEAGLQDQRFIRPGPDRTNRTVNLSLFYRIV